MTVKVQSQLLVSLLTRQRADALAVVLGEPRAEIYRKALEGGGLRALEQEYIDLVRELFEIGQRFAPKRSILEFAERAAKDGYTLADLREMTAYPEVTTD